MTMDENTRAKYEEKIKTLLAMAKKKKNVLEYQEISDHFADLHLEEEQMDEILDALEKSGIDVLRITMMMISRMKNCFCRMKTKWTWKTLI